MEENKPVAEAPSSKGPDKWEIEEATRTLIRAEEIRKDKKLMPLVHAALTKQAKAIKSVQDIRDASKELEEKED